MKTYKYAFYGRLRPSAVSWASRCGPYLRVELEVNATSEEEAESKLNVLYEPFYGFGTPEVVAESGGGT